MGKNGTACVRKSILPAFCAGPFLVFGPGGVPEPPYCVVLPTSLEMSWSLSSGGVLLAGTLSKTSCFIFSKPDNGGRSFEANPKPFSLPIWGNVFMLASNANAVSNEALRGPKPWLSEKLLRTYGVESVAGRASDSSLCNLNSVWKLNNRAFGEG